MLLLRFFSSLLLLFNLSHEVDLLVVHLSFLPLVNLLVLLRDRNCILQLFFDSDILFD